LASVAGVALAAPQTPEATSTSEDGVRLPRGELRRATNERLEYLSDFFVFVGREENAPTPTPGVKRAGDEGLVLAFDLNRGRDGETFVAEHFAVLWVDGQDWIDLKATSEMSGDADQFHCTYNAPLPSGKRVSVDGTAASGLTVAFESVELWLVAEPTVIETDRRQEHNGFLTGATTGRVTYGNRTFVGIVHHEFTYLAGINPLAKTYMDLFGDGFHGVYALAGKDHALRMHRSGGTLEPLIGRRSGYLVAAGAKRGKNELPFFKFDTAKTSLAGFFRWPGRYIASWQVEGERGSSRFAVEVDLKHRETLVNYVFGGVAIAIAKGQLREGDTKESVLGFALIVL